MKKVNIVLPLKEMDGQIHFDEYDNASISYEGYLHMNNIIGASIFMPDQIYVDGLKENPYIISNADGSIREVTVSSIASCNFNGKTITSSATVKLNVEIYFLNRLMDVISSDKSCGSVVKKDTVSDDSNTIVNSINNNLDLVAYINKPKVIDAINEYVNNKAFGERLAISLAQRNAMKKLAPFSTPLKNIVGMKGDRTGFVTVEYYYQEEKSIEEIISNAKNINGKVATTDLINVKDGTVIDVNSIKFYKSNAAINKDVFEKENDLAIRRILKVKYDAIDKKLITKASMIMFGQLDLKNLSTKQIQAALEYAETLQK